MSDSALTRVIEAAGRGDPHAAADLLPLVYAELRTWLPPGWPASTGQTLQPTALVHEAYLRLLGGEGSEPHFAHRGHFFAAAARAMRRILVESARRKKAVKHGGDLTRHDADDLPLAAPAPPEELLALDEALDRLATIAPRKAALVQLRYFAGLTLEEAAAALDISPATAKRDWAYSRAWLFQAVSGAPPESP